MLEDLLTSFVKLLELTMQRQNARPQGQAWKNLTSKFYAHGCVTYIQGNPTCRLFGCLCFRVLEFQK